MDLEFTDLEWAGPWVALAVGEVTIETPDIWILVVLRLACPGLVRAWEARADRGADKACGESRGTQEILILVAAPLRINRAADRQRRWATRGAVSKTRSRISCSR